MFPELLQIGPLALSTYSVMVDLAIVAAIITLYFLTRDLVSPRQLIDLAIVVVVSGVVGARLYYVIVNWSDFTGDLLGVFRMWEGGLVLHGAIIACILASAIYLRSARIPILKFFDAGVPAAMIAQAIGRLGCLMRGCCYGSPADLPWTYSLDSVDGLRRHPTALYEFFGDLVVFGLLLAMRKKKPFDGFIIGFYAVLYQALRFVVEFFRGDDADTVAGLRVAQWVSLAILVFGVLFLAYCWWRSRRTASLTPIAAAADGGTTTED